MQPSTLRQLIASKNIITFHSGIVVHPEITWVVPGENHLSYTTLTRIIECCREHHWETDIDPFLSSTSIDAVCKTISAEFLQPVPVSTTITVFYKIRQIRRKGYELEFKILSADMQKEYALFNGVFVFFNTETDETVSIPEPVMSKLLELLNQEKS